MLRVAQTNRVESQALQDRPVSAFGGRRTASQHSEFKAGLDYRMRTCLRQNKMINKKHNVFPSGELKAAVNRGWLIYYVLETS